MKKNTKGHLMMAGFFGLFYWLFFVPAHIFNYGRANGWEFLAHAGNPDAVVYFTLWWWGMNFAALVFTVTPLLIIMQLIWFCYGDDDVKKAYRGSL